jgi:hypothetical protein
MKSEGNAHFATTKWPLLRQLLGADEQTRLRIYGELYQTYWFPLWVYVKHAHHYDDEKANDVVEDFFLHSMNKTHLFEKVDQNRGRFRDYVKSALMNFARNEYRREHAKIRHPRFPFVEIDDDQKHLAEKIISTWKNPEQTIEVAWAHNVLALMVSQLDKYCHENAQEVHFKIFQRRVWLPFVEGCPPTPYDELAREFKLRDWKEAANMLETMKRTCNKLLREIVESYERPECVKLELSDVVAVLTA